MGVEPFFHFQDHAVQAVDAARQRNLTPVAVDEDGGVVDIGYEGVLA